MSRAWIRGGNIYWRSSLWWRKVNYLIDTSSDEKYCLLQKIISSLLSSTEFRVTVQFWAYGGTSRQMRIFLGVNVLNFTPIDTVEKGRVLMIFKLIFAFVSLLRIKGWISWLDSASLSLNRKVWFTECFKRKGNFLINRITCIQNKVVLRLAAWFAVRYKH